MMMNSDSRNTSRLFTGGLRNSRFRSIQSRKLKALSGLMQVLRGAPVYPLRMPLWPARTAGAAECRTVRPLACVRPGYGPCCRQLRRTPLMSRKCVTSAALLWLALTIGLPSGAAEPADAMATATAADPVQAIWKHQEIAFYFQSFTTFYSCTGLEGKLE